MASDQHYQQLDGSQPAPSDIPPDLESNKPLSSPSDSFCGRYEYCGPACGHEFHWTETFYSSILFVSLIMLILVWVGIAIPGLVFSGALVVFGTFALKLLWGYLATKTMAKLANDLRNYAAEFKASTKAYVESNEALQKENKQLGDSLTEMKQQSGMLDSHASDVSAVEKKLFELFDRHQKLIEEQQTFDKEQERFLRMQEEYRQVVKLNALKDRLRDQFGLADINRDGMISEAKEWEKLKQYVTEAGLKWPSFAKKIRIWEFMDGMNGVAPTPLLNLKDIQGEVRKLNDKLKSAQKGLDKKMKKAGKKAGAASPQAGVGLGLPTSSEDADDDDDGDSKQTDPKQGLLSGGPDSAKNR